MADICVLASGGLDSAVLLEEMGCSWERVFPLYVACGLHWEAVERHWLQRYLAALAYPSIQPLQVLALNVGDVYGHHWSTTGEDIPAATAPETADYLPGRNLLLLAKTAVFCALRGIQAVAMGHLRSNPHPDSTPAFFRAFEGLVATGMGFSLQIITPFQELGKPEVILRGRDLPLEMTFSCIEPSGLDHCGRCLHCSERQRAFREAGLPDPTPYQAAV